MASLTGWGRLTWGSGSWGNPAPVSATGVESVGALGSETVLTSSVLSVTGVESVAGIGTVTPGV